MQKFRDLKDLYNTVLPALKAREQELHREKFMMISKDSVWNYLLEQKWIMEDDLDLASIIDDIMNADGYKISKYIDKNRIGGTDYE
ncbi:MAG: hypothetical protein E7166_01475 [Firmicutes bacterium]|nr:hypothetical protein [Bacillota bacterium]